MCATSYPGFVLWTVNLPFVNRQIMREFNVHDSLIKWLESVEFKYTLTQPETNAVNFETLFGEIKY